MIINNNNETMTMAIIIVIRIKYNHNNTAIIARRRIIIIMANVYSHVYYERNVPKKTDVSLILRGCVEI